MAYIKKCLDSILNQSFQDFKIIIVDDKSTDLSDKFCEMYSKKYPDKIIYIQNNIHIGYDTSIKVALDYKLENVTNTQIIDCKKHNINSKYFLEQLTIKNNLNQITVAMATQPTRIKSAINVINELLPYCDRFCVCLNGFSSIPNDFPKNNKLVIICADGKDGRPPDLGCNNKMFWLGDFPGYYATVDDDIHYPANYIDELKSRLIEYNNKIIVSFHGQLFNTINGKIIPNTKKIFLYYKQHNDIWCHKLGMGVGMCHPKTLQLTKDIFLSKPKNFGDDEIISIFAQKNNIPLLCINNTNVLLLCEKSIALDGLCTNANSIILRNQYLEKYNYWKINQPESNINYNNEKIIITMTSWKKRINNVYNVLISILNNTKLPDKIILNLSTDEFKLKEKELPNNLLQLVNNNKLEIYWVKENTKPYKKTIPTLLRFPNDIIITIDDDIIYPKNFIETLYDYYILYDKQCPITAGNCKWKNNIFSHYGGYSLIKKEFYGEYLFDLYNNLVLKNFEDFPFSDLIFTYASLLNNKRYKFTYSMDMKKIRMNTYDRNNSISNIGNINYIEKINNEHKLIQKYIKQKYHKTYDDMFNAKIIINITTYPKRDKFLKTTLQSLSNQTLKPDKIILYLSKDEYNKDQLPETIQTCITENLLTDIEWLDKNIYCHKRHECFKKYNDSYNLNFDDDIIYPPTFIEELVNNSKQMQNVITVMASNEVTYNGYELKKLNILTNKVSLKNNFMGGRNCFPPYTLPLQQFYDNKLNILRDIYVKKCDEAWIRAFCIKYNIPIYIIHRWCEYKFNTIETTQETALYNENKQYYDSANKLREKERNFFNAIKILNAETIAKKIWPNMAIDLYKLLK